jgi:hypothetical protein
MIGNRAVAQLMKSQTSPNTIQPVHSSRPTVQSNPSGQVIQRVAHSVINLTDVSVTAKEGAEALSWDEFSEEHEKLMANGYSVNGSGGIRIDYLQ